jgi:hypothetical protein
MSEKEITPDDDLQDLLEDAEEAPLTEEEIEKKAKQKRWKIDAPQSMEKLDKIVRCLMLGESIGNYSLAARIYGYAENTIRIMRKKLQTDKRMMDHYKLLKQGEQSYAALTSSALTNSVHMLNIAVSRIDFSDNSTAIKNLISSINCLKELHLQATHMDMARTSRSIKIDALEAIKEVAASTNPKKDKYEEKQETITEVKNIPTFDEVFAKK